MAFLGSSLYTDLLFFAEDALPEAEMTQWVGVLALWA